MTVERRTASRYCAERFTTAHSGAGFSPYFAAYLLYRYKGAGRFASEACYLLAGLLVKGCRMQEVARVFSCEVEYSDINIDEALETFGQERS